MDVDLKVVDGRSFVGTAKWERNAGVRVFRRAMGV
jgi:hypothetical protein